MALNFLGLGFSLGAEDKGLAAALKDTAGGLADISKSVVGIGLASAKMILKPPDFKPALGVVQTLAGDVKTTTTSLEAYGVMASKATSAGLAGLNLTEQKFKEAKGLISNVAFSMNTDIGGVTKSFVALNQAGIDVNSQGFKRMFGSFEDYQKFIEVSGTDSVAFAASLGTMEKQMGMTSDQINDSVKSVAAIGKKFNIGREAIASMSKTVAILNENSNRLPQNWGPDRMQKFLKGTAIVSGALTKIGLTSDEAIGASNELTQALLKGETGMAGLYSGVITEIPKGVDIMTQHLGKLPDAFKMMQESPDQFILKMGEMVEAVKATGADEDTLNRFRLQMEDTFGKNIMAAYSKGFKTLGPAIKDAQSPIKDQDKSIANLSKRYEDGRTHAERFALAQDRVQTELKKVHGVMSDDKYLKEYNAQSKDFLKTMNQLASEKGPIGKATSLLIDFKMRGVGGALAAHSKWGFALSEGMKLIQPMLQYLPALGSAFKALMSPITLVAGAFAGLFFLFKDLGKGDKSVVRAWVDKMTKDAPALWAKAKEIFTAAFDVVVSVVKQIPWAKVGQTIVEGLAWALNGIMKVVDMINWGKVVDVLGDVLSKVVDFAFVLAFKAVNLLGHIIDWITSLDWGKIGHTLGQFVVGIFALAVDLAWTVIKRIPDMFIAIVKAVIGILDGMEDTLAKAFPRAAGIFHVVFGVLKTVAIPIMAALAVHFTIVAAKAVYSALTTAAAWVKTTYQVVAGSMAQIASMGEVVLSMLATAAAAVATGVRMAAAWVMGLGPIAWIGAAVVALGVLIYEFGDDIKAFFGKLWEGVKWIFKTAWEVIVGIVTAPFKILKIIWGGITGFFSGLWDGIKKAVSSPWEAIKSIILAPITAVKIAWSAITGFFSGLWDGIKSAASSAWSGIKGVLSDAWDGVTGIFDGDSGPSLGDIIQQQMDQVKKAADDASKAAADSSKNAMDSVKSTSMGTKVIAVDSAGTASNVTVDANKKTAEMVNQYVASTDKHLQEAAKLVFPKLSGDEQLVDFQKYLDLSNKYEEEAYKGKHYWNDKLNQEVYLETEKAHDIDMERVKLSGEMEKKYGQSAYSMYYYAAGGIEKMQKLSKEAAETNKKMTIEERQAFQEKVAAAQNFFAKEQAQIGMKLAAAKEAGADTQMYNEQLQASYQKQDAAIKSLTDQAAKYGKTTQELTDGMWNQTKEQILDTTKMMTDNFTTASKSTVQEWGAKGAVADEMQKGFDMIDKGYAEAMLNLRTNSNLTGKDLIFAIEDVDKKFKEQRRELNNVVGDYRKDLISGSDAVQSAIADKIKAANDKIADNLKKTAKESTDQAAIVAQEFKMSGADAADAMGKIAVIDPKVFRSNIQALKKDLTSFLSTMDKEAQDLVKNTDKSVNTFFEHSKKGWNDQEGFIKSWADTASKYITKTWDTVLANSRTAVDSLSQMGKDLSTALQTLAKSINLMDLLASPDQITKWASSVVSALAYAFMRGGAADAMISASYQKALMMASEISNNAGAATPDTGNAKSGGQTGAMAATLRLIDVINHPAWAHDPKEPIPAALALIQEDLSETLKALTALAEGRAAGRGNSRGPKPGYTSKPG